MFRQQKKNFAYKKIIGGVMVGLVLIIGAALVLTVISSIFNNFNLLYRRNILVAINLLIIAITGFFAARRVGGRGWLHGAVAGLVFTGLLLLLGSMGLTISAGTLLLLLLMGIVLGAVGGIIGVNF